MNRYTHVHYNLQDVAKTYPIKTTICLNWVIFYWNISTTICKNWVCSSDKVYKILLTCVETPKTDIQNTTFAKHQQIPTSNTNTPTKTAFSQTAYFSIKF